ncbi:hypothetical protein Q8W71_29860 [Methylobacterium sp. NEAU 140]|uniref:hypothetical protein n=1 Tax=Methylobacterium sp. NEAU 140 TaxID=3064945 RepID=UPI0027345D7D|nr:hypothetical protein [Methylobacterium sp. NEAU 140]MDP4026815.1 hypothetical protein [Methylobacterium sp. NEAU 140]
MSKPVTLTFTFPHKLGAAEVRRRLDLHTAWAFEQFAKERITIEADEWFGKRRAFLAHGYGMTAGAAIQVADDALHFEALVPEVVGPFAPLIEVIGWQYARKLFDEEGAAR